MSAPRIDVPADVLAAVLVAALAAGCVRGARLLAPRDFVVAPGAEGLAEVRVATGYPHEAPVPWSPEPFAADPDLRHAVDVGLHGWIEVRPRSEDLRLEVWTRSDDAFDRHDFRPVIARSGSVPGRFPTEVRFFDPALDDTARVEVAELTNPWNPQALGHGDLLLVGVAHPDGRVARYLLRARAVGPHLGGSAQVMIRVPVAGSTQAVSPILAAGPTFGYRTRSGRGPAAAVEAIELAISVGIGSTALEDAAGQGVDAWLAGAFDAALVGGGVELVELVTVQLFANASALGREVDEAPWTVGVGLDTVGLGGLARDLFRRGLVERPVDREP